MQNRPLLLFAYVAPLLACLQGCHAGQPQAPAGPPQSPAVPSQAAAPVIERPVSRWKLIGRFTALDGAGQTPIHTTSRYAVMSWARFDRARNAGGVPDLFDCSIKGPVGSKTFSTAEFGQMMQGTINLPSPGDYQVHFDSQDRYAVEVYEPDRPDVYPADSVPVPKLTGEENQRITDNNNMAYLQNQQTLHQQGQEWADRQAQEADRRARSQRMYDQMDRAAFGGGG